MKKDLSLKDIAVLSGVSRSTVSRVINDQPYVSAESRERVLRVIREHNYQPNLAARALVSQRSRVIGVLIPHDVTDLFSDPFFAILLKGIAEASNRLGYGVMLWLARAEGDGHNVSLRPFNESLIEGLVIASATFDRPFMAWLERFQKPVVFVGAAPQTMPNVSFVDVDNRAGAMMATRHLLQQGCQRIGMIEGRSDQIANIQRREGYLQALQSAGISLNPDWIIPDGNYTEQGGYVGMKQLLAHGVDGVFAANDMMGLGALRAIREAGHRVPEDIAVIGFDDIPFSGLFNPPLSTVSQPIMTLGEEATQTLIYLLDNAVPQAMYRILPVELVIRESTAKMVA